MKADLDFAVSRLGKCRIPSPVSNAQFVDNDMQVLYHTDPETVQSYFKNGSRPPCFEQAGPRRKIYPVGMSRGGARGW